jgi:hypothetical protein
MLEDFSFTIYYKAKDEEETLTLDLTCKDEREFDLWMIGIKALYYNNLAKKISKNELLSHSKSYNDQVSKGNIGNSTKFLFYNNGNNSSNSNDSEDNNWKKDEVEILDKNNNDNSDDFKQSTKNKNNSINKKKSLENFIANRKMSQMDIAKLIGRLAYRIKDVRDEVEKLTSKNKDYTSKSQKGYDMVFAEEAIADDLDSQKGQLVKLFKQSEKNLGIFTEQFVIFIKENRLKDIEYNSDEENMDEFVRVIKELEKHLDTHLMRSSEDIDMDKLNSENFLKELDIQLWKIEIDLENIGDIINRFKSSENEGFMDSLKKVFKFFK